MSRASVLPSVGRNSLEERGVHPSHYHVKQEDDDAESNAPSSPRSVYPDEVELTRPTGQSTVSQPYLCSSSPLASFPQLRTSAVSELRITDNSHSQSNPSQRKKGGCKSVQLTVRLSSGSESYVVAGKCDVRKSFSNRSFSKYYNRGPYAVVPLAPAADVVLVVEEAKRGRDGKHFVAMEQGCVAPWAVDDKRRHPLLAFAADAVYKVSVLTRPGAGDADVEVKCQFAQGSATVSKRKVGAHAAESKKRVREIKAESEDEEEADGEEDNDEPAKDAGKRRRLVSTVGLERCESPNSIDCSADELSSPSSPCSPISTTDSYVSSPSYPASPLTSSSPSPRSSPQLYTLHLDPPTTTYLLVDELDQLKHHYTAPPPVALGPFVASPLLLPAAVGGGVGVWAVGSRLLSPGGLAFSPWCGGSWMGEMEEFVL